MLSSLCLTSACALLAFATFVQAIPAQASKLIPLEDLGQTPAGWKQSRVPDPDKLLRFRIAIKQEHAFEFEQHLLAISDPDHASYGQHMKRDELKSMLKPSEDASTAVQEWLLSRGVPASHIEDDGDWINFYAFTGHAEKLLNTQFHYYRNEMADIERIRTLRYSVPAHLHQYIHMIQPTTRFGQIQPQRSTVWEHFEIGPSYQDLYQYPGSSLNVSFCNTTITPQCLRDLYHVGNFRGSDKNGENPNVTTNLVTNKPQADA